MAYAPCKNPNCKSYGKPHPNCRCYGEFAEGGEVSHCSGPHQKGCEYFAEGGPVDFDSIEGVPDVPAPSDGQDAAVRAADAEPAREGAPNEEKVDFDSIVDTAPPEKPVAFDSIEEAKPEFSLPGSIGEGVQRALGGTGLLQQTPAEMDDHKLTDEEIANTGKTAEEAARWASVIGGGPLLRVGGKLAEGAAAGSKFLQNSISNGLIQAGDEVSKYLLGQGDPQDPVGAALAHIGAAGLFGGLAGKAGALAQKGVSKAATGAAETKFGEWASYYLAGLASGGKELGGAAEKMSAAAIKGYKAGQKQLEKMTTNLLPPAMGVVAEGAKGYKEDGVLGGLEGAGRGFLHGIALNYVGKGTAAAARFVAPVILKIMASGKFNGVTQALDHAADVAAGSAAVNKGVDALFKTGTVAGTKAYGNAVSRKKLDDFISGGGVEQMLKNQMSSEAEAQGYAEGGEVKARPVEGGIGHNDGLATHYPEQNVLMSAAKGRISSYLNGLRPQTHNQKLAFDDDPDTTQQRKAYEKALDIANSPLGVLDEVRNGTIEPEHVKHLNALHPEVNGLLQKKLVERITKAQVSGEKPPYAIRQGLSMLMGTPLSGELTPSNIMAAQSTFARGGTQTPPNQPAPKSSKTSTLTKADQAFLTGTQARVQREQKER